ncbi:MAG TPA: HD domain-containing protein [Candidatus Saccharimonadia bacterium]|nr:HD domain-containing protein [Candidatus Saccharimonadia bacterium]
MNTARDVDLLYELGAMRFIDRQWIQFYGPNVENLAEHTLRVAWISLIIGMHEQADTGKVLKLALIHDIGESRTGDANWLNKAYLKRDESKAAKDMLAGTVMAGEGSALWLEMEALETLESKIVKDADGLDVDLEFREQQEHWKFARSMGSLRQRMFRHELHTETARRLWQEIQTSDPHKWYLDVYLPPNVTR